MRKILLTGLAILICMNIVGCSNNVVAKINDVEISKDEYNKISNFLYATGYIEKKEKENINSDILSFIIDNEVAYQDAKKENITVKDKEVNEKFEDLKDNLDKNSSYKEKMQSLGIDDDFIKKQVEKDLVVSKYKENFIKNIKISDKEIKKYYENHKDEFSEDEVKASQILISTLDEDNNQVSKEEKEKLKAKAQNILDKVNKKEDFAKLAKKYSDDKKTGKDGGNLGYFSKTDKNIEFTNAVFKLKKNQISDIIETEYGYHIVKVTDKKNVTKTLEDSKEEVKSKILNQRYIEHIDSLYKKGKITIT